MEKKEQPLKVCSTCHYWSTKFKGFCERLHQGVGQFHICPGWCAPGEAAADFDHPLAPQAAEANRR
jgi:hypothetical protein